jgi:broad specificity phosphatase PhoE
MSTPTTSARIFLIRHGETDWITGGKFASRTDVPLSTMGERDVELIRERLVAETEMINPAGVAKMSVPSQQRKQTPSTRLLALNTSIQAKRRR